MMPVKRAPTGGLTTAYASLSQNWNGTTPAFTSNPTTIKVKPPTIAPDRACPWSACPICARFKAPVCA